jgi:hypothetical protein
VTSTATSSIGGGAKADQKGVEGLSADMKAVTMAAADSKELTPRGTSSKVRDTTWQFCAEYSSGIFFLCDTFFSFYKLLHLHRCGLTHHLNSPDEKS